MAKNRMVRLQGLTIKLRYVINISMHQSSKYPLIRKYSCKYSKHFHDKVEVIVIQRPISAITVVEFSALLFLPSLAES